MSNAQSNHKGGDVNRQVILDSEYSRYADFIIAQARFESANFKSRVYQMNNNPFGMKTPSRRPFLGTQGTKAPDGGFYARYPNDTTAFKDLLVWLKYVRIPNNLQTVGDYVRALKAKRYFEGDLQTYIKGVERWMNAEK